MKKHNKIYSWSLQALFFLGLVLFTGQEAKTQGFYFGPKGGMVLGFQNWNGFERDPLFAFSGDLFIETLDPNKTGSLYASIGYHVRGSAVRVLNPVAGFRFTQGFRFNNISVVAGAKKKFKSSGNFDSYYLVGIRGEYNLSTDFGNAGTNVATAAFFPIPELTNKFTYGITGGAGLEFYMSEFVSPFIELTINPDLSFQYNQPSIGNVTNPFTGITGPIPEREIRNMSIELTVGFKFLRKVVYID